MHDIVGVDRVSSRSSDRRAKPAVEGSVEPAEPALKATARGVTRRQENDPAHSQADRFGISFPDWVRAVEQTIVRSTGEQGLPLTIDDERALATVANIVTARSH